MSLLLALLGGGGVNAPGAAVNYTYSVFGGPASATAQAPGGAIGYSYSLNGGAATAEQAADNTPGIIRWRRWQPDEETTKTTRVVDADVANADVAETTARIASTRRQIEKAQADLAVAVADADIARDTLARSRAKAESTYRARIEGRQAKASAQVEAIKIEIATLYKIEREAAARVVIFETDMAFVAAIMMEC